MTEEKIEFRDENGELLDDEQVKALEGKVSFSTRYETRTRVVDGAGNEIYNALVEEGDGSQGVHGTAADGPDPETGDAQRANTEPASVGVEGDVRKERSLEGESMTAEPESEVGRETGRDEL